MVYNRNILGLDSGAQTFLLVFLPTHPLFGEPGEPGLAICTLCYTECVSSSPGYVDFGLVTFEEHKKGKKGELSRNSLFKGCPGSGKTASKQDYFSLEPVRGDIPSSHR